MSHNLFAAKDFSKRTLKALANKGLFVVGIQLLPGDDGSWANAETGYVLADGTIQTFLNVLDLSTSK